MESKAADIKIYADIKSAHTNLRGTWHYDR